MEATISTDLIRGHTETIVLNVLRQGDSYGYEVCKQIAELCHGQYELKEATLYTVFRRLEREGLISSYWGDESQGGRRKYYRITEVGLETYRKKTDEWRLAVRILAQLMEGEVPDEKS